MSIKVYENEWKLVFVFKSTDWSNYIKLVFLSFTITCTHLRDKKHEKRLPNRWKGQTRRLCAIALRTSGPAEALRGQISQQILLNENA